VRSGLSGSLLAICAVIASACDPCAGTPSCRGPEHVAYTGHMVERATERSAPGTVVTFIRTGGVQLAADTIRAAAASDGFFLLSASANSGGDVTGILRIGPPNRPTFDVPNIVLHTTTVNGDGGDLGRLVVDPFIMFVAEVRSRLAGSPIGIPYANVTFRRTGGIAVDQEVINTSTDISGRFIIAPNARQAGVLQGIITISASGFAHTFDIPVSLETIYQDVTPHDVSVLNIGASLLWAGEIYRRGSNEPAAGIPVDFVRTSGLAVTPSSFTSTTTVGGLFAIQPAPLGEGELVGTITVHPPAPWSVFSVPNVRVHTVADDTVRLAGRWGYGAQVFGAVQLLYRTTMQPVDSGASIIFRRTGGALTQPDTFVNQVNQFGSVGVQLAASAAGEVIGNLEVRLGEPYGTEVISGKHLASAEDDVQRFAGTHLVGRWFPQFAQLLDSVTHAPIPGARVSFTRVSGVAFAPDPYITTPNADGYFALRPQPLADGEVIGNMTFELPPPYRNATALGIHLKSSMDDSLRFVAAWFIAPSKP
jgi:hypothetical protein